MSLFKNVQKQEMRQNTFFSDTCMGKTLKNKIRELITQNLGKWLPVEKK